MPILGVPRGLYKEPERLTKSEARLRRVQSELRRVEVLEAKRSGLSPANKVHLNRLKEFEANFGAELEARRERLKRAEKEHAEQESIRSRERLRAAMFAFSNLAQRRSALRQRATAERRSEQLREASAANRRFGLPGVINPRTIFGNEAWIQMAAFSRSKFRNPVLAIPCIERVVRREVMFAKRHAGKGHRSRHRFGPLSHIGC